MIPCKNLFGNNRQIVLSWNQQIYMVDSAKKYPFQVYHLSGQGVLNRDPFAWLDVARSHPQDMFPRI